MKKCISFLTLSIFLLSLAGISFANEDEIVTFGYNPDRQRSATEKMFPPVDTGWYPVYDHNGDGIFEEVGETRSQPLILDGERFGVDKPVVIFMAKNHANGNNYLYGFEAPSKDQLVNGFAVSNSKTLFEPVLLDSDIKVSRSSTTFYDGGFATGTADGRIMLHQYNPISREMEPVGYKEGITLGTDIVSSPMLTKWKGIPVIITGSNDGYVYLITNFHLNDEDKQIIALPIGGVISSSPSPIYDSIIPNKIVGFVIGRDDATGKARGYFFEDIFEVTTVETEINGKIKQIDALKRKPTATYEWEKSGLAGIPSSFTTEADYTYFADKYGRLTKVNNKTGDTVWIDTSHFGSFINNSPAIDDKYVYYAIKDIDIEKDGDREGYGAVVVLNKEDGSFVGLFVAESRITTSPVVWQKANVVLFGCENGHLVGFWRDILVEAEKSKEALAIDLPAFYGQGKEYSEFYPSERANITGLTGEISIAQDLLVLGGQMPVPEGGGVIAYQLKETAPDWFITNFENGLPEGVEGAELEGAYVASMNFSANGLTGDKPVKLEAKINSEQAEIYDVAAEKMLGKNPTVIIYPGEEKQYTFVWQTPVNSSNIILETEINPDRAFFEEDYSNNYFREEIMIDKIDIEVIKIEQNSPVQTESMQTAKVAFANLGSKNTSFTAKYYAGGKKLKEEVLTINSGGVMERSFSWQAPDYQTTIELKVEAELLGDLVPDNNSATKEVVVKYPNYTVPDCQFGQTANKSWEETYSLIVGYGKKRECDTDCWTDADGNRDCDTDCWWETDYNDKKWDSETVTYNEGLSATVIIDTKQDREGREGRGAWEIVPYAQEKGLDPKKVTRAGYGFEVKVVTDYWTDWETKVPDGLEGTAYPKGGTFYGPTKVEAEFYDTQGDFVEAVELEPTSGSAGDYHITWQLPVTTHTFHDGTEVIERKHYVPLDTPDGKYTVRIIVYNAGKHDLSICQDHEVIIYGSMWDDVYYRPDTN